LSAEVASLHEQQAAMGGLTGPEQRFLLEGLAYLPYAVAMPATPESVAFLETYFSLLSRIDRDRVLDAAASVLAATLVARSYLSGERTLPPGVDAGLAALLADALARLSPIAHARAQASGGCGETSGAGFRFNDCANDVLFMDPWGLVLVSGAGRTIFDDRYGKVRIDEDLDISFDSPSSLVPGMQPVTLPPVCTEDPTDRTDTYAVGNQQVDQGTFEGGFVGATCVREEPVGGVSDEEVRVYRRHVKAAFGDHAFQVLTVDLGGSDLYMNNQGGAAPIPNGSTAVAGFNFLFVPTNATENRPMHPGNRTVETPVVDRRVPCLTRSRDTIGLVPDPTGAVAQLTANLQLTLACPLPTLTPRTHGDYRSRPLIAVSLDVSGNDRYESPEVDFRVEDNAPSQRLLAQGAGASGGIGILVDAAGNDRYRADNASQGASFVGGVGILVDLSGNDDYSAGNFSQGVGGFFAQGFMADLSPEPHDPRISADVVFAGDGSQGAAGAFGGGFFANVGGDDRYRAFANGILTSQGSAGFFASAVFLDVGGTDQGIRPEFDAFDKPSRLLGTVNGRRAGATVWVDTFSRNPLPTNSLNFNFVANLSLTADVDVLEPERQGTGAVEIGPVIVDLVTLSHEGTFDNIFGDSDEGDPDPGHFVLPGLFVLGSPGSDVFTRDYVLAVDLGGDDTWRNNAGGTVNVTGFSATERRLGLAEGDDGVTQISFLDDQVNACMVTSCTGVLPSPVQGSDGRNESRNRTRFDAFDVIDLRPNQTSFAAALVDLSGADVYEAPTPPAGRHGAAVGAQGFGYLGVGFLVDADGDDRYVGADRSQGAGFLGVGVLADLRGRDTYRAGNSSQGAGGGVATPGTYPGIGILFDASPGTTDVYTAGNGSQGFADDGVALLVDVSGVDRYDAGFFSQGAAIGVGVAALVDGEGNDAYRATDLAQGAAVAGSRRVLTRPQIVPTPPNRDTATADIQSGQPFRGRANLSLDLSGVVVALLADHAGADEYLATGAAVQGFGAGARPDLRRASSGESGELGLDSTAPSAVRALGLVLDAGAGDDTYRPYTVTYGGANVTVGPTRKDDDRYWAQPPRALPCPAASWDANADLERPDAWAFETSETTLCPVPGRLLLGDVGLGLDNVPLAIHRLAADVAFADAVRFVRVLTCMALPSAVDDAVPVRCLDAVAEANLRASVKLDLHLYTPVGGACPAPGAEAAAAANASDVSVLLCMKARVRDTNATDEVDAAAPSDVDHGPNSSLLVVESTRVEFYACRAPCEPTRDDLVAYATGPGLAAAVGEPLPLLLANRTFEALWDAYQCAAPADVCNVTNPLRFQDGVHRLVARAFNLVSAATGDHLYGEGALPITLNNPPYVYDVDASSGQTAGSFAFVPAGAPSPPLRADALAYLVTSEPLSTAAVDVTSGATAVRSFT
ncbi:MAG: hypothetical protein ACT4PT_08430, partial [Methanobacteriota archaeon]